MTGGACAKNKPVSHSQVWPSSTGAQPSFLLKLTGACSTNVTLMSCKGPPPELPIFGRWGLRAEASGDLDGLSKSDDQHRDVMQLQECLAVMLLSTRYQAVGTLTKDGEGRLKWQLAQG